MTVLVVGATGQTGRRIVQELVSQSIGVKAVVRDAQKAQEILPETVETVVGDVLKPNTLENAIADCDTIICATGASPSFDVTQPYLVDLQGTKNLVDLAKNKDIERFIIVSSLCVSKFFHPLNLFWLVLFWKKQAEKYIQQSGLTYTIVRPGGLKNEDNDDKIVAKGADSLCEGSIPRQKVAQVCVAAIAQPAAQNKIVEIVAEPDAEVQSWEDLFASV